MQVSKIDGDDGARRLTTWEEKKVLSPLMKVQKINKTSELDLEMMQDKI